MAHGTLPLWNALLPLLGDALLPLATKRPAAPIFTAFRCGRCERPRTSQFFPAATKRTLCCCPQQRHQLLPSVTQHRQQARPAVPAAGGCSDGRGGGGVGKAGAVAASGAMQEAGTMRGARAWAVGLLLCQSLGQKRRDDGRLLWIGPMDEENTVLRVKCKTKVTLIVIMHAHDTPGNLPHLWWPRRADSLQIIPGSCQEGGLRQRHPGRG